MENRLENDFNKIERLLDRLASDDTTSLVLRGTDSTDRLGIHWVHYGTKDIAIFDFHHLGLRLDENGCTQAYGCNVSTQDRSESLLQSIAASVATHAFANLAEAADSIAGTADACGSG